MKHSKRILSILLAVMLALGLLAPAAQAAPPASARIIGVGGDTGIFEVYYSNTWNPLNVPFWRIENEFALAFCLESDADAPVAGGSSYNVTAAMYNNTVVNGLRAILMHGAPNDTGGLQAGQAWYATQAAVWTWMYEQAGVGHAFYEQSRVRAAAGEQATYNFYLSLLNKARNNTQLGSFGISASPSTVTLTDNGSGQLVGTTTISFTNLNGDYSIDQSKIPAGVSVVGSHYQNGDIITVRAPASYAGQTITMTNVLVGHDSRVASNVFWYSPNSSGLQNMVVFDFAPQPVAYGSISCTSEEQANYAEVKALATGDERIMEMCTLEAEVSKLKLLKSSHMSQRYELQDRLRQEYPKDIALLESKVEAYSADTAHLAASPADEFAMELEGITHTEKKAAGSALLELCKATTTRDPLTVGSYRGFLMKLMFDFHEKEHRLILGHKGWHSVGLGTDLFGNLTRIDNLLGGIAARAERCVVKLAEVLSQAEKAKEEAEAPFLREQELAEKSERLSELKTALQVEQAEPVLIVEDAPDEGEKGPKMQHKKTDMVL